MNSVLKHCNVADFFCRCGMTPSTIQGIMKEDIVLKNKFCQLVVLPFGVKLFNAISSLDLFFFMNNKHNNNEFPILLSGYMAITVYEGHILLSQQFHRCSYRVKCLLPQYPFVCVRKSIGLDSVQFTVHQYILTINGSKRRTKINCIISIKQKIYFKTNG